MKNLRAVGGLLLALSVLPGCDSEQPLQTASRGVSLDFATYVTAELVDVWDRYQDPNHDGVHTPNEAFDGLQCGLTYPAPTDTGGDAVPHAALWGFSAEITVLRSGALTAISVLPPSAATSFTNFPTAPDENTHFALDPPTPKEGIPFDPEYVFVNQRRMLNTSSDVMRCFLNDLPVTNLAGYPLPFEELTLAPGDTLIVKARSDASPPMNVWLLAPLRFDAQVRIDGVVVIPEGTTSTSPAGGSMSFSYQSR